MAESIIKTEGLTKYYGKTKGVEDLNLEIDKGEIFGFLGPNGAGKTTTIRLLLRLINPTEGKAFLFGKNVQENYTDVLKDVGYLPSELNLYNSLTGARMLSFFGAFHNGAEHEAFAQHLVKRLKCQLDKPFRDLSSGNKRKIGIVLAAFHRPKLLVLDEPTIGLDPISQKEFYKILFELREGGTTIFFSSHNLPEVERICDRAGIIRDGVLVQVEKIEELKRHRKKEVHVQLGSAKFDTAKLESIEGIERVELQDSTLSFYAQGEHMDAVVKALAEADIKDVDITYPDLEHVFLKYYEE